MLDRRDVLSMTLIDLLGHFSRNFFKIILVFVAMSIISIVTLHRGAVYKLDVDPRICAYEYKCKEKGFIFFVDILDKAVSEIPSINVTGWNELKIDNLWYSNQHHNVFDIEKVEKDIRSQILSREQELAEIYKNLIEDEVDVQIYQNELLVLKRRLQTLNSIENIVSIKSVQAYGPLDHFLGLSYFVFLMATTFTLFFLPLLSTLRRVQVK